MDAREREKKDDGSRRQNTGESTRCSPDIEAVRLNGSTGIPVLLFSYGTSIAQSSEVNAAPPVFLTYGVTPPPGKARRDSDLLLFCSKLSIDWQAKSVHTYTHGSRLTENAKEKSKFRIHRTITRVGRGPGINVVLPSENIRREPTLLWNGLTLLK